MRFRPANIRLINRRSKLPRLLLALSSGKDKGNDNDKNNPTVREVDTVTPYQAESLIEARFRTAEFRPVRQRSRLPRHLLAAGRSRSSIHGSAAPVLAARTIHR